jgi:hypothetical protein
LSVRPSLRTVTYAIAERIAPSSATNANSHEPASFGAFASLPNSQAGRAIITTPANAPASDHSTRACEPFAQEHRCEHRGEEGRRLVDHGRLGERQMHDGRVEADQRARADRTAEQQQARARPERRQARACEHERRDAERDRAAREHDLHRRQRPARELDEQSHHGEPERGVHHVADAPAQRRFADLGPNPSIERGGHG